VAQTQTVTVVSHPHAAIRVQVVFPDHTTETHVASTGDNGVLVYRFVVSPQHAHPGARVVVYVDKLNGGQTSTETAFFVSRR
jgi:hypothetical protein